MTQIDYDFEFSSTAGRIDIASVGMVDDQGRTYYAINGECDLGALLASNWLMANVVPSLPLVRRTNVNGAYLAWDRDLPDFNKVKSRAQIASEVRNFVLGVPEPDLPPADLHVELWADYGAYDHVALCQLFGTMMDLPEGFPMWTHDIQQEIERLGLTNADLPKQVSGQHNALTDALHQQQVRRWIAAEGDVT